MADQSTPIQRAIEGDVLRIILDEAEKGILSLSEAQAAATMTLQNLAPVKDQETILNFYAQLSRRFPIFELLYTRAKESLVKEEELAAYEEALKTIEAGDIKGARAVIDQALQKTAHEATNT